MPYPPSHPLALFLSLSLSRRKTYQRHSRNVLQSWPLITTGFEGNTEGYDSMGPDEIIRNRDFRIPRKIVGVGLMDENWGWASSYFLNRLPPFPLLPLLPLLLLRLSFLLFFSLLFNN